MHSHQRTLIASLGFADQDKKNPLHDTACQYLARQEGMAAVAAIAFKGALNGEPVYEKEKLLSRRMANSAGEGVVFSLDEATGKGYWHLVSTQTSWESILAGEAEAIGELTEAEAKAVAHPERYAVNRIAKLTPTPEFHITKGQGQYKTTIGFADLVVSASTYYLAGWDNRRGKKFAFFKANPDPSWRVLVEVKIDRIPIGDILRQLRLYKEYFGASLDWPNATAYLLATAWAPSADDLATLAQAGIHHCQLGEKFTEYASSREHDEKPATNVNVI